MNRFFSLDFMDQSSLTIGPIAWISIDRVQVVFSSMKFQYFTKESNPAEF